MCSTRLGATADQPEGHALREPQETTTIDGAKAADSSTEQESNVATLDTPVAAAAAAAAAAADSAEGRSSEVGGEGGVEQAPTMAAVGQVDSPAIGGGQSREEEEVMAELLAQQPGGPEENEGGGEDEGGAKPMVRAGVFFMFCYVACDSNVQVPEASLAGEQFSFFYARERSVLGGAVAVRLFRTVHPHHYTPQAVSSTIIIIMPLLCYPSLGCETDVLRNANNQPPRDLPC